MNPPFDPDGPAAEDSGLFGLPHGPDEARVHVFGVPFDATTSYRKGAAHGPAAVLAASRQVDLFDLEFDSPWRAGIYLHPVDEQVHAWNREAAALTAAETSPERVDALGAEVNALVEARVDGALADDRLVAVVGGDHSVPFGAIRAAARRSPGLGLLHVDAHADLRVAYEGYTWSHASILHNLLGRVPEVSSVVQCGIRDLSGQEHAAIESEPRVHTLFDRDWRRAKHAGESLPDLVRRTLEPLPEVVWLTFDVDGLDPTLCPNTGTPVPGGFDWHEAMLWLDELAASGRRVVGMDLCEVSPGPAGDPEGESWDAIVGARLLYRMIGAALVNRT